MNAIKIAILVTDFTLGGIQNYVRTNAKLLKEMKHKVSIIAINDAHVFEDFEVISLNKLSAYKKPLFIRQFINDNSIDVLMDHRTKLSFIKHKIYDFLLRKTPKIQFIHSANFNLYFYTYCLLDKLAYKHTAIFISVSKHINQLVNQKLNKESDVLYHFIEQNTENDYKNNKKDIIFVGRFENNVKDLTFLLNAYKISELHLKNVAFHFIGDGNDKNLISEFALKNNLTNFIQLHAAENDLETSYKQAKVVVLASHFEGFPLVLMEALHYGTPVITTPFNDSVFELVQHNFNGIVVEKKLDSFADALNKMCCNDQFYNTLLQNIEKHNDLFTKDIAIKKWETIFEKLFKNRIT
ncbi:glycosyltransferase [Myroides sp. JBRI-B21084]|uniref:glycosyltransferase n=1 Tax=Myroides sp. JBRI-B21084 TaxID=3119977 RepID=UPI0026E36305|nr:glycosyltransferase [Paenimyroides cloacae]WKW45838.1 glycosyltransferase [Paenimyroides cloacae]